MSRALLITISVTQSSFKIEINNKEVCIEQDHDLLLHKSVTGSTVWDSCVVLAKFLEEQRDVLNLKGKRTIELGSGCGLLGIAAAMLGGNVTLTDQENILGLLHRNVEQNSLCGKCRVMELVWGRGEAAEYLQLRDEGTCDDEMSGEGEFPKRFPELVLAGVLLLSMCIFHDKMLRMSSMRAVSFFPNAPHVFNLCRLFFSCVRKHL